MSAALYERPPVFNLNGATVYCDEQITSREFRKMPTLESSVEEYGKSLSTIRQLGRAVVERAGIEAATQLSYDDFSTKLTEMLKTDEDYGQEVDVNRDDRIFEKINGRVCNEVGVPMVEVVENGFIASSSSKDERLSGVQAVRDEGDVIIAMDVDGLKPGETLIAISLEPLKQLKGIDGKFWHDLGYREGIAYIQMYCCIEESTVAANAYSVDHSTLESWRKIMQSREVDIPKDVDENKFIRYAYKFSADLDEAKQAVTEMKCEHYMNVGSSQEKIDTKQVLNENSEVLLGMFNFYYPTVGKALVTGHNDQILRGFANEALSTLNLRKLKPEVRRQIVRIANSSKFDDDMARALTEDLIPYATVEIIRKDIKKLKKKTNLTLDNDPIKIIRLPNSNEYNLLRNVAHEQQMHNIALSGIQNGITAGRSYGGCSGVNVAADGGEDKISLAGYKPDGPQDIYGGKTEIENISEPGDKFGSYIFKCGKCGYKNDRRKEKDGWVYNCHGCGVDTSCGRGRLTNKVSGKDNQGGVANLLLFKKPKKSTNLDILKSKKVE